MIYLSPRILSLTVLDRVLVGKSNNFGARESGSEELIKFNRLNNTRHGAADLSQDVSMTQIATTELTANDYYAARKLPSVQPFARRARWKITSRPLGWLFPSSRTDPSEIRFSIRGTMGQMIKVTKGLEYLRNVYVILMFVLASVRIVFLFSYGAGDRISIVRSENISRARGEIIGRTFKVPLHTRFRLVNSLSPSRIGDSRWLFLRIRSNIHDANANGVHIRLHVT